MNKPILDIINYIKDTIDIISTLKVDEILSKYKKGKNVNTPEDFEGLLRKEEASLRQHIALENKLKLDYETLNEKINSLEAENNILKKQINEQKENYEKKIEEINKENINLTNMKNDIQKNERKLRKKLDIKEKEIFQLQSKLNSINSNANNNGEYSNNSSIHNNNNNNNNNTVKIVKNITSNTPFYSKKNVDNINNINYDLMSKKGRNNNKFSTINANSNSMHRLNKCNSMSKINYKNNISEKENIFNDININQKNLENNTIYAEVNKNRSMLNNLNNLSTYNKGENISIIKKIKNDIKPNNANDKSNNLNLNIINEKNQHKNNLNHSSISIKDNNERNIIGNILDVNTNNSIDTIKIEQKNGNNYVKIKDNKLLIINQKQPNRLKRTFSAVNSQEKNNNNNNNNNQKEKLMIGKDITPDKLSNYNQNISNSILKINDNSTSRKFYLLKKTPKKNGYKNSMPNIKGMNIYKNNIREINHFQFLANKMGNNINLNNNNYKIENYSHLKYNDYKRISPQNKILGNESNYNFNNTNIINNKIIQKEGNINNNIIIINGEIVEQNNKDEYPLISINKNNISLKRVSLKSNAIQELNKTKK